MTPTGRTGQAEVRAAGAVLWRDAHGGAGDGRDGVEVALVHRPRYDDWSLPKGKLDEGETVPAAAVREVAEETGLRAVLGRGLGHVSYPVSTADGRELRKRVDYFAARAVGADGEAGVMPEPHDADEVHDVDEVDEVRWLRPESAERLLTHASDRRVLGAFTALPAHTRTLLLVRHAKAGKRSEWTGDDDLRPLTKRGWRQAAALRNLLPLFGASAVHSAPRVRCLQTVQALADDLDVDVHDEPLLSEEGYWPDPPAGLARLLAVAAGPGVPVVSSQGGVIPDVVARLARDSGVDLVPLLDDEGDVPSRKGSLWLLSFTPADEPGPPRLLAADYFAQPFA
ncbi:NUDIX hydrolase [Streptoalloteichus hindustanus]|uniref:8-oxo-dGTP diphosphatase n=1 Tax=Streptoalloteichus hindustanus TaxID=2017 RepID=A0A1M5GRR1_STRHI|nr:NUDIX hydrolase [Streptoalloteichus hindustanus]SHG06323.1 8-oxo-dGTP diphosphatase [Streptoalloteichus hindustanus]